MRTMLLILLVMTAATFTFPYWMGGILHQVQRDRVYVRECRDPAVIGRMRNEYPDRFVACEPSWLYFGLPYDVFSFRLSF